MMYRVLGAVMVLMKAKMLFKARFFFLKDTENMMRNVLCFVQRTSTEEDLNLYILVNGLCICLHDQQSKCL